jgi:hypothetical protein
MSEAWRFDALHPRGGMAFACFREEDRQLRSEETPLDKSSPTLEKPAVFIAPPAFEPETIPNRLLGFSAGKGSFQTGLFSTDGEIGFASLEDLIEFVRRVYVESGGGDGFNDGGFQGPPGPQEGPGMPPYEPEFPVEESKFFTGVSKAIEAFNKYSNYGLDNDRIVIAAAVQWAKGLVPDLIATDNFGHSLQTRGAAMLLIELLNRTPHNLADVSSWYEALVSLCTAIQRSGGWNVYEKLRFSPDIISRASRLGVDVDDLWHFLRWRYGFNLNRSASDLFEDLIRWPLPDLGVAISKGPEDCRREPSVFDLMSAFFANPDRIWLQSGKRADVLAVIIFASAHLTGNDGFTPDLGPETQLSYAISNARTNRAWEWIAEQMPRRAFSTIIESMIETAAMLRYSRPSVRV